MQLIQKQYNNLNGQSINVGLDSDSQEIWITQKQLAELFSVATNTVTEHIKNIYSTDELEENTTTRNFRIVQIEGSREVARDVKHYNLDMIIALGFRVNSKEATIFRKWANVKIKELLTTGKVELKPMTALELAKSLQELATKQIILLEDLEKTKLQLQKSEATVNILTHVNKLYTATEIAKECGLHSAQELNKILHNKKIQYKVNDTWVFYTDYANLGYDSIKQSVLDSGKVVYDRKFTQIGREFILNTVAGNAIDKYTGRTTAWTGGVLRGEETAIPYSALTLGYPTVNSGS